MDNEGEIIKNIQNIVNEVKEYLDENNIEIEIERENSIPPLMKQIVMSMSYLFEFPPADSLGEAITAMMLYFNLQRKDESFQYYKKNEMNNKKKLYELAWELAALIKLAEGEIEDAIEMEEIIEKNFIF